MKVIDMLDRIANGEEVPHFRVSEVEYFLNDRRCLREKEEDRPSEDTQWFIDEEWLNKEVEIIEDKINKDIKWYFIEEQEKEKTKIAQINMNFKILREKLTEIIDKLNEMEKE